MVRSLRLLTTICSISIGFACSKKDERPEVDPLSWTTPKAPTSSQPNAANEPTTILPSGSAPTVDETPVDAVDPARCPVMSHWLQLDGFAPACGYAWTTEKTQLPAALQWQGCDSNLGIRSSACKQLFRNRRRKHISAGLSSDGTVNIGFVEECQRDQIVIAEVDGPVRFALRAADVEQSREGCEAKLLAVDMGKWIGALGSNQKGPDALAPGYTMGGGFVGGDLGERPTILFSQSSQLFHVATMQGEITFDGWSSGVKRLYWNGKPFEKPPEARSLRLTKRLWLDERTGILMRAKPEPKLLLPLGKGMKFVDFVRRGDTIVWREILTERGHERCHLVAGELDKYDILNKAWRLSEIPCNSEKHFVACNSAIFATGQQVRLMSLLSGSQRRLHIQGHVLASNCKEAFIEQGNAILRIELSAFGKDKTPGESPMPLILQSAIVESHVPMETDAGVESDAQP